MLIDWVTAKLPERHLSDETLNALRGFGARVMKVGGDGNIEWECSAWESIRSDSHQVAFQVGAGEIRIQGSPARIMGDGCTVFGSGAAAALDLPGCVHRMAAFVRQTIGSDVNVPPRFWQVTRVDVTENLVLDSLEQVREALKVLSGVEQGRLKVSQKAGDTVYWQHRSRYKSGKAYAKGPHLRYLLKRKTYTGRTYSEGELQKAEKLLRLELSLKRDYWRKQCEVEWWEMKPNELRAEWKNYFGDMLEGDEIQTDDLRERLRAIADTEGQASSAYGTWLLIEGQGWERAKNATSKSTWYRNIKLLHKAGLNQVALSTGKVVLFKRKSRPVMELESVDNWGQLMAM